MRTIGMCVSAFLASAALAPGAAAGAKNARLLSSGATTITFEVLVPAAKIVQMAGGEVRVLLDGYGTFSPAGAIELPGTTFRVAIPPDGTASVFSTVVEEESLGPLRLARVPGERLVEGENGIPTTERYQAPDPWINGGAPQLCVAGEPSFMGRQRVLPIRVNPLVFDGGEAHLIRRLSISVVFEQRRSPLAAEAAAAPPLSGTWKRLYDDLLINPGDVSKFRKPLVQGTSAGALLQNGKQLKLRVPETGIYAIRADSLIAAGLSPHLPTGANALFALRKVYYDASAADLMRKVDVPFFIVEDTTSDPNYFDGNDLLVFYALGIKDDAGALDTNAVYTDDNVLWLEEQVAGDLMTARTLSAAGLGQPITQFNAVVKSRKDAYFMRNVVAGDTDFYFITGPNLKEVSLPFAVSHPSSSGTFSLLLRTEGNERNGLTHTLTCSIKNSAGTHQIGTGTFTGLQKKTWTFSGASAAWLVDGQNELVIDCDADYAYLANDFKVTYPALFVARDNMLEFAIRPAGEIQTFEISGFSVDRGYLIEVTNPLTPVCQVLGPADFTADGGGYKISLGIDAMAERRFVALGSGAGGSLAALRISVDTPSRFREEAGPYNVLAVSHRDFLQRTGEYVAWRRNQGYRPLTADVEDVFDEFNGGNPSAYAVKRFIQYGVDHWGVEFVVLVGDGSNDHKRIFLGNPPDENGSGPDFVPSYSYCNNVNGPGYFDEVIASDKWFEFVDGSAYPDVIVGRLPFGSDVEARAFLNKLYRFESPEPDDAWRRRIILFPDDAWSGRGTDYRFNSYEQDFEWSTDTCRTFIESALPGGFDIEKLYLSKWTDPIHPNRDESGAAVWSKSSAATRQTFTPALVKALNDGCLFFVFQGHANRSLLTHEGAFGTYQQYDDLDSLRTSIPNVFMGFGCHLSEFARDLEFSFWSTDGPHGDCFCEQLLFKPGAGSVATYASDAYEYLNQNSVLCEQVFKNFFSTPPVDSVEPRKEYTGAHWIFGEAVLKAEIEQIDNTYFGSDMVLRYHILGDPLLKIDPGPPLLRLEADWGEGYRAISPDSVKAHNGTNRLKLRLTASDVVAIGRITLQVNGQDWTDSMQVTPLADLGLTHSRSYRAEFDYTVDPKDELLVFKVFTPDGRESGVMEMPIVTTMRLFYNDYLEILPGVESPPTGTFRIKIDFPAYLSHEPVLAIDGLDQDDVHFTVPDAQDSLHWEAVFRRTLPAGKRVFTVKVGEFTRDFAFSVTGNDLVVNAFNFPNPFNRETNIIYTVNLPVDAVKIDIYNVSGVRIRTLELPPDKLNAASFISPHSVLWDGRDLAGDRVANGTYIYVLHVERAGQSIDIKGKSVKLE